MLALRNYGKLRTSISAGESLLPRAFRALATGPESKVKYPTTAEEYRQSLLEGEDGSVSYFTAAWCGPCRAISPLVDQLSLDFPKVAFLKLDIDNEALHSVANEHEVSAVPTFVVHKGTRTVDKFTGADPQRLVSGINKLGSA